MARVFFSHSSFDKAFVRRLATALRRSGHEVWLDEAELLVGDSLATKIADAVESADVVVAVISPASVSSGWVARELEIAMERELKDRRAIVLPILIGDAEVPAYLRGKLYLDFRGTEGYKRGLSLLRRKLAMEGTERLMTSDTARKLIAKQFDRLTVVAHALSSENRAAIVASPICGCFYCLSLFPPSEINEWIGDTAQCPVCGIDAVLGSASGSPISKDFLKAMYSRWFGRGIILRGVFPLDAERDA